MGHSCEHCESFTSDFWKQLKITQQVDAALFKTGHKQEKAGNCCYRESEASIQSLTAQLKYKKTKMIRFVKT